MRRVQEPERHPTRNINEPKYEQINGFRNSFDQQSQTTSRYNGDIPIRSAQRTLAQSNKLKVPCFLSFSPK